VIRWRGAPAGDTGAPTMGRFTNQQGQCSRFGLPAAWPGFPRIPGHYGSGYRPQPTEAHPITLSL